MTYLQAKSFALKHGYVCLNCDYSYETQEERNKGNVLDKTLLEMGRNDEDD